MFTHLFRILKHGTSYAIATGFFPPEIAKNVLLLYSFVRIPDNIVDDHIGDSGLVTHYIQAKIKLETMQESRTQAYMSNDTQNEQRGQYICLFQENNIPFPYSLDFFKAMIDDCSRHTYRTYEELEWYMYGSASVVGLMMCHLIGFTDSQYETLAKEYATVLWNAMQLTNFLRDVREDYEDLNRIYMPLEDLQHHGLSHDDIISFCHGWYATAREEKKQAWSDYMKMMIQKCREMYPRSMIWLQYLRPEGRKAVRLAAVLYEAILDKIEHNHYDVFTKSCRTHLRDKSKTLYTYRISWTKSYS